MTQSIQNLTLNKTLYIKNILRYKKSANLGLIDYSVNFSNTQVDASANLGKSILYSVKQFQHRNYKELKLQTFLPYQQLATEYQLATNFSNITKTLQNKQGKNFLQILRPTKGGYLCYYAGLLGFLPKSHFRKILTQSLDIKSTKIENKLYFSNLHITNQILKPHTLFKIGKIAIQPHYIVNNFNDLKVRKSYDHNINFVFVSTRKLKLCKTLKK